MSIPKFQHSTHMHALHAYSWRCPMLCSLLMLMASHGRVQAYTKKKKGINKPQTQTTICQTGFCLWHTPKRENNKLQSKLDSVNIIFLLSEDKVSVQCFTSVDLWHRDIMVITFLSSEFKVSEQCFIGRTHKQWLLTAWGCQGEQQLHCKSIK